jgi:hypothetical protein
VHRNTLTDPMYCWRSLPAAVKQRRRRDAKRPNAEGRSDHHSIRRLPKRSPVAWRRKAGRRSTQRGRRCSSVGSNPDVIQGPIGRVFQGLGVCVEAIRWRPALTAEVVEKPPLRLSVDSGRVEHAKDCPAVPNAEKSLRHCHWFPRARLPPFPVSLRGLYVIFRAMSSTATRDGQGDACGLTDARSQPICRWMIPRWRQSPSGLAELSDLWLCSAD